MTTKFVLKYTPIGSGIDLYWLSANVLNNAVLFNSSGDAMTVGIANRTIDEFHNEAVVMQVDVEEDTVLPSKDVRDQPLPPK